MLRKIKTSEQTIKWFMNYWNPTVGAGNRPNPGLHLNTFLMLPAFVFYTASGTVYIL